MDVDEIFADMGAFWNFRKFIYLNLIPPIKLILHAQSRGRPTTPMARPGEGCHPPCDRCYFERYVGYDG